MSQTKYANKRLNAVPSEGGHVRVTIATTVGQGNGGTSLPCKSVLIHSNGITERVNIGAACTSITGIQVPQAEQETNKVWNVLEIPIDDVSKLYFYGSNGNVIDILYRL